MRFVLNDVEMFNGGRARYADQFDRDMSNISQMPWRRRISPTGRPVYQFDVPAQDGESGFFYPDTPWRLVMVMPGDSGERAEWMLAPAGSSGPDVVTSLVGQLRGIAGMGETAGLAEMSFFPGMILTSIGESLRHADLQAEGLYYASGVLARSPRNVPVLVELIRLLPATYKSDRAKHCYAELLAKAERLQEA